MYQAKNRSYGIIAVIFYVLFSVVCVLVNVLWQKGVAFSTGVIIYLAFIAASIITALLLMKDRNPCDYGFGKEHLRTDIVISLIIVAAIFLVSLIFSDSSFYRLFLYMLYELIFVAALEEILFRGLIQNYLFGFRLNKYVLFVIGGLLFSLAHFPGQMIDFRSMTLNFESYPTLIETFIAHIIFCFIACKRNNVVIPIALHFLVDYLSGVGIV